MDVEGSGPGQQGEGPCGMSVWKLKFPDDTESSEITGLQELPLWIGGDHLDCMFLLLANDCLKPDV